ncbi:MAG: hypothetical protein EB158_09310, partial [Nitrosopumilaceae archaeon]|nr:hypothetical protein [Nitrosopumilaceae archaeon]
FCSATTATNNIGPSFSQTVGVALPRQLISGAGVTVGAQGGATGAATTDSSITNACSTRAPASGLHDNVVRENKTLNRGSTSVPVGQIGVLQSNYWPFIQLYNLNPTGNVVVQYNKGGGVQSTTLKFDTVDQFAKLDLDRTSYPRSAQVQATITDTQLNIDPTDEDSWTFGTTPSNATVYYGVFSEDGALAASSGISSQLTGNRTNLMFEDNGLMKVNLAAQGSTVLALQDNADTVLSSSGYIDAGRQTLTNQPVTITETAPNVGVFGTYDESDKSVLKTTSDAARGKSATIDYNDKSQSVTIGFGFASVDIKPTDAEWNSGEEIPVTVTDSDANKNSRADEDLDLFNPSVALIPSLRIGTPFTLGVKGTDSSTTADSILLRNVTEGSLGGSLVNARATAKAASTFSYIASKNTAFDGNLTVNKFSDRAVLTTNITSTVYQSVGGLLVDTKATGQDLKKSIFNPSSGSSSNFHGFNLLNIDLRGINNTKLQNASVWLLNSTSATSILTRQSGTTGAEAEITATTPKIIPIAYNVKPQSLTLINATHTRVYSDIFGGTTGAGIQDTAKIGYLLNFTRVTLDNNDKPFVIDLFSFGYKNDGVVKSDRVNNAIYRIEAEE